MMKFRGFSFAVLSWLPQLPILIIEGDSSSNVPERRLSCKQVCAFCRNEQTM